METARFGFIALLLVFYNYVEGISRIDPLVQTNVGLIRGLPATDGDYSMFLGIPFGKVNKSNPFGPSSPYPVFEEVFEAFDDSVICPQSQSATNPASGTVDCLNLQVYVPNTAHSRNRLPVLVWVHGGGFMRGSGGRRLAGARFLMKHDIILVSITYRVGPYGFFCLDTPEVPGNQGLKDQLLAFRWVKNNIEAFGGDPNRITLGGQSAGAMSIDLHLVSDVARTEQLYHQVILNSGSSFVITVPRGPRRLTDPQRIAQELGYNTNDATEALNFLINTDPQLVVDAAAGLDRLLPCLEQKFENVESYLTEYPLNRNIPRPSELNVLIGITSHEHIYVEVDQNPEFYEEWDEIPKQIESSFNFTEDELKELTEIIRHFYLGDKEISKEVQMNLADFGSDVVFGYPAERSVAKYVREGVNKVFYYMFSYDGGRNSLKIIRNLTVEGAAHGDDVGYLFDSEPMNAPYPPEPEDQVILDRMTTMWANFVKYGDPTPETSDLLPIKWQPITRTNSTHYYLNIDTEMEIRSGMYHKRMAFWELFYNANRNSLNGYRENESPIL